MNTNFSTPMTRGGYSKSAVACSYFPDVDPNTARRNLNNWIKVNETLIQKLMAAGYRKRQRYYTPLQLSILYDVLGEP